MSPPPPQEDGRHEQVSDVRTQLKFLEQLDRLERQRKEEQEREILLKAAKVTVQQGARASALRSGSSVGVGG